MNQQYLNPPELPGIRSLEMQQLIIIEAKDWLDTEKLE